MTLDYRRWTWLILVVLAGPVTASGVKVVKQPSGWQLLVDGQPYVIRGVAYAPTPIGEDPALGNWRDWMVTDDNHNGQIDAAYESWVDQNGDHRRNDNEPTVGDFKLMQDMGVNTLRLYHHATLDPATQAVNALIPGNALHYNHPPNKDLLRDLFKTYGIRVAMGDFLGAYVVGSGADWDKGTDYRDRRQQTNMLHSVEAMVRDFKDEPYIVMWILGNENNYRGNTHTNAETNPEAYAQFVNRVALRIHQLDPRHPVCLCNGETRLLRIFATAAPAVDIFGVNCYRRAGFGTLWREVSGTFDRPVLLTEYGLLKPRIVNGDLDEDLQSREHRAAWCDIEQHLSGAKAPGNAIGGFAFEFVDQWWYNGQPSTHNEGLGGFNNEWHGLTSQGDGADSPLQRHLRKAYFMYEKLWKTHEMSCQSPDKP